MIAGLIAFAATFAANLAITWLQPTAVCRTGPLIVPLFMLGALMTLLLMAAAAGFATGRASGAGSAPALAGLLVGVLGGCALVALIPFMPGVYHRVQELSTLCPDTGSFGGGGSFSFNVGETPPPGVVLPTPPPGFFAMSPPPEAFGAPPAGPAGIVSAAIGMLFTIGFGVGLAVGAAALGGQIGAAGRPPSRSADR